MKAVSRLFGLLVVSVLICSLVFSVHCFAQEEGYEMSADPRLAAALKSYEEGLLYLGQGDWEYRMRPGLAQKLFEHAEDYFLDGAFRYKELGLKYGIDTTQEVATCNALQRKAHVWVNKSRKNKRGGR